MFKRILLFIAGVVMSCGPVRAQEFRKPIEQVHPSKVWFALALTGEAMAGLDMHETKMWEGRLGNNWAEHDPIARPFVQLPAPALYTLGFAGSGAASLLGLHMRKSRRWHNVWWLPQVAQIAVNAWGLGTTIAAPHTVPPPPNVPPHSGPVLPSPNPRQPQHVIFLRIR